MEAELEAESLEVLYVTIEHQLLRLLFFKIFADSTILFVLVPSPLEDQWELDDQFVYLS